MISSSIKKTIEKYLSDKIISDNSVGGGCIADSRLIKMVSGNIYFLKQGFGDHMFEKEANSLIELLKPDVIKVPDVILSGSEFLLLEAIQSGNKSADFFNSFGKQLAKVHKYSNDTFGFIEDNFIGASPQYNLVDGDEASNWSCFYWNKRLVPQFHMAKANGYVNSEFASLIDNLENKLEHILDGSQEEPSLLHGDLWSGNFMVGELGEPVLIDPAVYYGHRETDLAMTKLFGGFPENFYDSYNKEYPLKNDWQYRMPVYLLYHLLNHLNLFGSGYYSQVIEILRKYRD